MRRRRRIAIIGQQRLAAALCPYCGKLLDACTGAEVDAVRAPRLQAGDYSLCGYCLKVMRFDGRFHQQVSEAEAAAVLAKRPIMRSVRDGFLKDRAAEVVSVSGKRKETVN